MHRAFLKTYSNATVNTGHTPPRVEAVFAYRARAKPVDAHLAKLFGLADTIDNAPRIAANALEHVWREGFAGRHFYVVEGRIRRVMLVWSKDPHDREFFFVEINVPRLEFRRSVGMPSREFAMDRWHCLRVSWYAYKPLTADELQRV